MTPTARNPFVIMPNGPLSSPGIVSTIDFDIIIFAWPAAMPYIHLPMHMVGTVNI